MITWEPMHKQILSKLCVACPGKYFSPYSSDLPHVGCCSYSPVFTLFEIYKMLMNGDREFFLNDIYRNTRKTINDFEIIIHANLDSKYESIRRKLAILDPLDEQDLKLRFSVCQFFIAGLGCGLKPDYKNGTCRSFICSTIEEGLDELGKREFKQWVTKVSKEVKGFNDQHTNYLRSKGWNLRDNLTEILDYLSNIS